MADPDRYDALIVGAGMSGLAAGIRLAQMGRRVAVLERHTIWGGLNSFYKLGGRRFDVGLHALTNYVPPRTPGAPLTRILRQLRLRHADLKLGEQTFSEIVFPGARLRFSNDPELLLSEVERAFPSAADGVHAVVAAVHAYDADAAKPDPRSARAVLHATVRDPLLAEMLLLPMLYYGSPTEHDLDWGSCCVLFRSILLEGLARPEGGIKPMLDLLVARLKDSGAELRLRSGVASIRVESGRARGVVLDDGREIAADLVLSSAGWIETMRLAGREVPAAERGRLSFLESLSVLDADAAALGHGAATTFYCTEERAAYAVPDGLIDPRSGVLSAPGNFASSVPLREGLVRQTVCASPARWDALADERYAAAKAQCADRAAEVAVALGAAPPWADRTIFRDVFTPRTIRRFTWRDNGAVYGSPAKRRDGSTPIDGLVLCGTDQGWLGVTGALMSGIAMANRWGVPGVPDAPAVPPFEVRA